MSTETAGRGSKEGEREIRREEGDEPASGAGAAVRDGVRARLSARRGGRGAAGRAACRGERGAAEWAGLSARAGKGGGVGWAERPSGPGGKEWGRGWPGRAGRLGPAAWLGPLSLFFSFFFSVFEFF